MEIPKEITKKLQIEIHTAKNWYQNILKVMCLIIVRSKNYQES